MQKKNADWSRNTFATNVVVCFQKQGELYVPLSFSNHPCYVLFVCLCVMCFCIIHFIFCVPELGSPNPSSG